MSTYGLHFFLGPGRALGFAPSTPAPKPRFDPVFGLEALVVFFPPGAFGAGCGVSGPAVSAGGDEASGLTSMIFDSSSGVGVERSAIWFRLTGGAGNDAFSGVSRANRARILLGSLKHIILLGFEPLLIRAVDGGVETLERELETRRIELFALELGGILT